MVSSRSDPRADLGAPWGVWSGTVGLCVIATWLVLVGFRVLANEHLLVRTVTSAQVTAIGPLLLSVVAVVFVAERLWPAVRRPALATAHIVDACYLALYALIGPLLTLLDVGFAAEVQHHAHFLLIGRLPLVPKVLVVAAILLGIDAMNWAAHLANHRSAVLWRSHALHHSQEDMSVLTTFRTHPLTHVSYLPALLPALVLSASGSIPAIGLGIYGCLVVLPHANLRWSYGPFGRVLVSPAFHRLHHAAELEGRGAVNFGFVLTVWDRLGGTAMFPSGSSVRTGIAGRPVPVEQAALNTRSVSRLVFAQLVQPLRLRSGLEER